MTPRQLCFGACAAFVWIAPAAAQAQSAVPRASEDVRHGFSLKAAAGANYARLYDIPTYGGEVSAAIGGRHNDMFGYLGLNLERSRTEMGLAIWGFHFNPSVEWKFGLVRLGAAGRLGYWNIRRVTRESSLESGSIGAAVRGSVDVIRPSDESAIFLQSELRGDYYADGPWVPGVNLSLGYRWDATHRL